MTKEDWLSDFAQEFLMILSNYMEIENFRDDGTLDWWELDAWAIKRFTVVGIKRKNLQNNLKRFGQPHPEGYRKALPHEASGDLAVQL